MSHAPPSSKRSWFGEFVRHRKDEILADWLAAVRSIAIAQELSRPALLDHLPQLLDRIADMADTEVASGRATGPSRAPAAHALARLEEGYDLGEVVTEYAVLRECILRQWEDHGVAAADPSELRILNRAIDHAISISVARFTTVRERTLLALDRIAAAALGTDKLETFLPALLFVLKETTPAVHSASLLLRDEGVFVVRAAVGTERAEAERYGIPVDEGFVGRVAREGRPILLRLPEEATADIGPLCAADTRVMLGLPLVCEQEVIGVAAIGASHAADFSDEDRLLFSVMATRASAMIEQHRLRELAERRAVEAERASKARDEVLAIVSHDLRNPLASIVTASAIIAQSTDAAPTVRRGNAVIQRSSARMTRLLDDLLDVNRIESGRLTLQMAPHSVADVVTEALEAQRSLAEEKKISLSASLDESLPPVRMDREQILRVLANLLGNAIKFTPASGAITVGAAVHGGAVRLSVADTGRGISEEHLAHVFERFWQAADATRDGAGLGLPIVKGIVDAHGGDVWGESRAGKGSTFFFTLPIGDPG